MEKLRLFICLFSIYYSIFLRKCCAWSNYNIFFSFCLIWKYTINIYVTYEIQYIIIYVIKLINSIMISILRFSDSQNLEQFFRTINHLLSSMDTAWENDNFFWPQCYSHAKLSSCKKIDWAGHQMVLDSMACPGPAQVAH